nr:MAG TPA: hypothetical protein [Caudoviricetes sp.]
MYIIYVYVENIIYTFEIVLVPAELSLFLWFHYITKNDKVK